MMPNPILSRVQWVASSTTNQILPIVIHDVDGDLVTSFSVAFAAHNAADEPAAGSYVPAVTENSITGARVQGMARGLYLAYPKIGDEVLDPIPFKLT